MQQRNYFDSIRRWGLLIAAVLAVFGTPQVKELVHDVGIDSWVSVSVPVLSLMFDFIKHSIEKETKVPPPA